MDKAALPPGQRWIEQPIVYDIGRVTPVDLETFSLRLRGDVERPSNLSWADLAALPRTRVTRDFHCVTTWSVRSIAWEGVSTAELIRMAQPRQGVVWVLARSRDGYSTHVPMAAFCAPDSLLADRMRGDVLPRENGYPLRLVIPSLYAWKSAKYVEELEFRRDLALGFWEARGYHDRGDPWLEERFRAEESTSARTATAAKPSSTGRR